WGWHIPTKLWRGLMTVVDFAFPTKAPPDESPLHTAPDWLPEDEEEEEEPEPLPVAYVKTEEPEVPDERLTQARLPVNWWATEDDTEEEAEKPAKAKPKVTDWRLPPLDLLANAAPTDESAKPDNALRAKLIVD